MSEKEIAELFEDIQDDLEKLQGTGETFMFFTEKKKSWSYKRKHK